MQSWACGGGLGLRAFGRGWSSGFCGGVQPKSSTQCSDSATISPSKHQEGIMLYSMSGFVVSDAASGSRPALCTSSVGLHIHAKSTTLQMSR